ncbi:unnamed protein product [Schistosoma curassoni]|uniref:Uncharacterized protein n=1 Tax=Schistosoma curassoni TaxID=6186 RepID=A0A183JUT9_9TREM|nr:unnamed protein product [Schistosoma curassoni]
MCGRSNNNVAKATRERNTGQLHDATKKLAGNYRKPEQPVKSKEGKVITNIEEQRDRWAAGPANIPAEALKAEVAVTAKILHTLLSEIWNEEQASVRTTEASLFSQYQQKSSTE